MERVERTMGADGIWRDRDGNMYYSKPKEQKSSVVRYKSAAKGFLIRSETDLEVESLLLESSVKASDSNGQEAYLNRPESSQLESIDGVVSYVRKFSLPTEDRTFTIWLFQIETSLDNLAILGDVPLEKGFHVKGNVRSPVNGSYTNQHGEQKRITYKQVDNLDIFGLLGNFIETYPFANF